MYNITISEPLNTIKKIIYTDCIAKNACSLQLAPASYSPSKARRYDMSTSLPLTKWPPNFRMILICYYFSVDAVLNSTTIPQVFIHTSTLHSLF